MKRYKIISITDHDGNIRTGGKPGQYYDRWNGMTVDVDLFSVNKCVIMYYVCLADGTPAEGWMHTSSVKDIEINGNITKVITKNSVYTLEEIDEFNINGN